MKRLVYTPKAFVYVKDKTGKIHDLTSYVMSGQITRKTDQVSDAEVTLRNPHMLFTLHTNAEGEIVQPIFSPMDPITIFLRRVKDRPVRVFTGFLDKVPYLQLYPGPITFTASCTLKRLQHTYFDPALPYTMSFFQEYGWNPSPDGQWSSLTAQGNPNAGNAVGVNPNTIYHLGDSLAEGTIEPLKKELGEVKIQNNAVRGQSTTTGIDSLEDRLKRGKLPPVVVISLGTNDPSVTTFRAQVRRAIQLVGADRHIIWPNIVRPNKSGWATASQLNEVLREEAQKHRNLTVVDWSGQVATGKAQLASDGIHASANGYSYRASQIADAVKQGGGQGGVVTKQKQREIDGSLSQLLMATMGFIGHWDPNDVYIESLPEDLFERVRAMADEKVANNTEAREEFANFLKSVIGSASYGSESGKSDGGSGTATGDVKGAKAAVPVIEKIAEEHGLPPEFVIAVSLNESGLGNNMHRPGAPYWGWFQQNITAAPYGNAGITKIPTQKEALDLGLSCDLYCRAAARRAKEHPELRKPSNWTNWYLVGQGMKASPSGPIIGPNHEVLNSFPRFLQQAKGLLAKYGKGGSSPREPAEEEKEDKEVVRANRRDGRENKSSTEESDKLFAPVKGSRTVTSPYGPRSSGFHNGIDIASGLGDTWYAICDGTVEQVQSGWANGQPAVVIKASKKFEGYPSPLYLGYGSMQSVSVKAGDTVRAGQAIGKGGTHGSGPHLHFWLSSKPGSTNGSMNPDAFTKAAFAGGEPTGGPGEGSTDESNSGGTTSGSNADNNFLGAAYAASFAGSLQLPSVYDAQEAAMLGGERSLMNDKPLLPFIQQLTQASMRKFQSLPDGRFYAFYPDYFGEMNHHPPYWEIDDIEILDGKVELSDESLVTHMYVVGDTLNPQFGGSPDQLRSYFSNGIVTIFNAFMASDMLERDPSRAEAKDRARKENEKTNGKSSGRDTSQSSNMNITMDRDEAASFLNRYGARPWREDAPMVRSVYFEMFLAYQMFLTAWARQFLTPFSFTFMPELYPGGKVGFKEHGLQMYIEEVTHTWDYTTGFTTEAVLSSPSQYKDNKKLPPNMVRAIIDPSAPAIKPKGK